MPRSGPGPVIGVPYMVAVPLLAVSKPAMMRSSVDLPQPEAPIRQMNSPLSIDRLASRSASTVLLPTWKRLPTWSMERIGLARGPAGSITVTGVARMPETVGWVKSSRPWPAPPDLGGDIRHDAAGST